MFDINVYALRKKDVFVPIVISHAIRLVDGNEISQFIPNQHLLELNKSREREREKDYIGAAVIAIHEFRFQF